MIVFSVTDAASLSTAETILQSLCKSGDLGTKVVIVVGNKTDLVRTRTVPIYGKEKSLIVYLIFVFKEGRSLAISYDCKYVEVSSALDHNVDTLLVGIVKQIRLKMKMEKQRTNIYAR